MHWNWPEEISGPRQLTARLVKGAVRLVVPNTLNNAPGMLVKENLKSAADGHGEIGRIDGRDGLSGNGEGVDPIIISHVDAAAGDGDAGVEAAESRGHQLVRAAAGVGIECRCRHRRRGGAGHPRADAPDDDVVESASVDVTKGDAAPVSRRPPDVGDGGRVSGALDAQGGKIIGIGENDVGALEVVCRRRQPG